MGLSWSVMCMHLNPVDDAEMGMLLAAVFKLF
jgi:hypothetical protein